MTRIDGAACHGPADPNLMTSPEWHHHLQAREFCKVCPVGALLACRALAKAQPRGSLEGTWAGQLYKDGYRKAEPEPDVPHTPRGKRLLHPQEHGTPRGWQQHRTLHERACDECKEAHNADQRKRDVSKKGHGDLDEQVVLGVLAGELLPTTKAERMEIMRRWLAEGRSEKSLCDRMGWRAGRYRDRQDQVA